MLKKSSILFFNMFSSYIEHPKNSHFEGQDADEEILLLLRAHPITNLSWIIPVILLLFLPAIVPQLIDLLTIDLPILPPIFATALVIINYLLVLVITFEGFLYWYFNVNIITDRKIIDIDFVSVIFKNVDQALLKEVQEAQSSVGGFLGMIFNFGNVFVQTAGANVTVDFKNIPHPTKVADLLMDQVHKVGGGHAG